MSQRSPASEAPVQNPVQSSNTSPGQSNAPETLQHAPVRATRIDTTVAERQASEALPVGSAVSHGRESSSHAVSPSPARSFEVHSILNPSHHDARNVQQQRQTTSESYFGPASQNVNPLQQENRALDQTNVSLPSGSQASQSTPGRRILTPRSPINRASTLPSYPGGLPAINPDPRYTREGESSSAENTGKRISDGMSLPSLRPQSSAPYGAPPRPPAFGSLPEPSPSIHARRTSGGSGLGLGGSQDASPSTSHSSYSQSQFSQTSPATVLGMMPRPPAGFSQPPHSTLTPYRHITSYAGGPSSTGGQLLDSTRGTYEMTLDTEHGPLRVPVDVQQASHVADEKRKRNAGASARFRARRKEKEREAAQTIANLERELREMTDERDHYASERNFLKDMLSQHVPLSQMPPRPASPRHRRLPQPPPSSTQIQQVEEHEEPAARRRRTNEYQPTTGPPPQMAPIVSRPSYGAPAPPTAFQMPLPEPRSSGGSAPPPPGSMPPRQERFDPFRREQYHGGWNPTR
ncbi:MAG: hypothetical protein Q9227_004155 [Pyrenula ochraceoflavens]